MSKIIETLKKIDKLSIKENDLDRKANRSYLSNLSILLFFISPVIFILNIVFPFYFSNYIYIKESLLYDILLIIYLSFNILIISLNINFFDKIISDSFYDFRDQIGTFFNYISGFIVFLFVAIFLFAVLTASLGINMVSDVVIVFTSPYDGNIFILFSNFFITVYCFNFFYIFKILKLGINYSKNLYLEIDVIQKEIKKLNLLRAELKKNRVEIQLAADFVKSDKADEDDIYNLEKFITEVKEDLKVEGEIENRKINLKSSFDNLLENELKQNKINIQIDNI